MTSSSPPGPMSPATFHILLALALTERHGYDIMKQAAQASGGRVNLGPGTLYGTIKQLLAQGAITESAQRPDLSLDDQRRRYYQLTEAGRHLLNLELERLDQTLRHARGLGIYPLSHQAYRT